ncbi:hypothetical protein OROMI_021158 [Orobanche minor]
MLEEIPQKRAAQKLRKKPHLELISQDLLILAVTFQLNIWLCYYVSYVLLTDQFAIVHRLCWISVVFWVRGLRNQDITERKWNL